MGILKRWFDNKKDHDFDKIRAHARLCLDNPDGEIVLNHLIDVFEVDHQVGLKSGEESVYINGKQDGLKYILALISKDEDEK